jgi:hypothetical protein
MSRFYSPEWVDAFNEAVADLDVGSVSTGASLVADDGTFRVDQVVRGGPGGELVVTLVVDAGRLRLELDAPGPGPKERGEPGRTAPAPRDPDVTIVLSYDDAAAMSRGELDPADAVTQGRVRVRGDLALLVAAQALLAAAGERLQAVQADTTY